MTCRLPVLVYDESVLPMKFHQLVKPVENKASYLLVCAPCGMTESGRSCNQLPALIACFPSLP